MTTQGRETPGLAVRDRAGTVLAVRGLRRYFPIKEGAMQRVAGHVKAVDDVSFELDRGTTLGLVGESGCGKTTLGRVISGLSKPTDGGVYFDIDRDTINRLDELLSLPGAERTGGEEAELASIQRGHRVDLLAGEAWKRYRRNCQVVFQDSFASLNPRHLVKDIVGRPLKVQHEASGAELIERVVDLLDQVGLGRQHLHRYPHQFSGGQRQRISIARALALDPELLVLDEPTSALDVSVQAQILNLLHELQRQRGLTYLFITHDLSVVRHMADEIVVMYVGKVAESGPTDTIFATPRHPYTKALLSASPDLDDGGTGFRGLEGSVPDPARPPQGCRFHTRCPVATPICGWDVDDVVLRLQDEAGLFDDVDGVEHRGPFDADLRFGDEAGARRLAELLASTRVPEPMRAALEEVTVDDRTVRVRFREVGEVELRILGPDHQAACVLATDERSTPR